jgi:hypothetical protein
MKKFLVFFTLLFFIRMKTEIGGSAHRRRKKIFKKRRRGK